MNLLPLLRQHEVILQERFGIATIGIFGSYVRREERVDSDVDVLVTFQIKPCILKEIVYA
ncbi:MAG: nucleotidyltransferase domain-containing protein [Methanospirillum sp.]|uniref:nucleotidyltransferase family protein n=1 Tax=Methanospirillum sp. TaxID=45200 RepID=UPI0023726074|nr:nucleotidyltransferase domain-containing protein [Methanospirillum sp.]MDD1728603.1 nucleotidyltransferase domain-containing protein [Methanospirillum sp.]